MKEKDDNKKIPGQKAGTKEKNDLQGYPLYPASEDIFSKYKEEKNINPEDVSRMKEAKGRSKTGISNSRIVAFENSGHSLFLEETHKFNSELIKFAGE